jgi:hypothetical protein
MQFAIKRSRANESPLPGAWTFAAAMGEEGSLMAELAQLLDIANYPSSPHLVKMCSAWLEVVEQEGKLWFTLCVALPRMLGRCDGRGGVRGVWWSETY